MECTWALVAAATMEADASMYIVLSRKFKVCNAHCAVA
jgi:hypothetical protein